MLRYSLSSESMLDLPHPDESEYWRYEAGLAYVEGPMGVTVAIGADSDNDFVVYVTIPDAGAFIPTKIAIVTDDPETQVWTFQSLRVKRKPGKTVITAYGLNPEAIKDMANSNSFSVKLTQCRRMRTQTFGLDGFGRAIRAAYSGRLH